MTVKKVLLVIIGILLLISIGFIVYLVKQKQEIRMKAAPVSTLSFEPANLTASVGESFTLEVVIETGTNTVPAVEVHLTFDPAVFEATSFSGGPDLGSIFDGPVVDNDSGTAFIVVGDVNNPVSGTGTVASITFRVKDLSDEVEKIDFSSQTQAGAWQEEGVNVLVGTNPALVTVVSSGLGGLAATATPTPDLTPTPYPTPTPESDGTGGLEPTATPEPTETPFAVTPTVTGAPTSVLQTTTEGGTTTATQPVTAWSLPTLIFLGVGLIFLVVGIFSFI